MKTYKLADGNTHDRLHSIVNKHHPQLKRVSFDVLEVRSDSGNALTANGYGCIACVRIVPLKDRACGRSDVEIVLDADKFGCANERAKSAILDHELTHLEPMLDKDGRPRKDSLTRPRLQLKRHDWQFGWFNAVAKRWGTDSIEVQQAIECQQSSHQLFFPLFESKAA